MVEKSIITAIRYGRTQDVHEWLETHKDPDRINQLLLDAARSPNQNSKIIEMLLSAGADPNYVHPTSSYVPSGPPLRIAVQYGSVETVKLLIEEGADRDFSAFGNMKAVNSAAFNHTRDLQAIIEYLISLEVDLDAESDYSESALRNLSRRGRFDIIKTLLDAGANPSYLGWDDLIFAVVFGTVDDCRKLLDAGASIKHKDRFLERTPFLLSIQVGDIEKAELLLHHGASLEEAGYCDRPALMYTLTQDKSEMLKWLIARGGDINQTDKFNKTVLMEAAESGAFKCMDVLLRNGAEMQRPSELDDEAINLASNIETVRLLKNAGADINRVAGDGYYLLKGAAEDGNFEFAKQLLELGSLPDVPTLSEGGSPDIIWGETALHRAVWADDIDIIKLLLSYGANPNILDVDRYTPLHIVQSPEAAQTLMKGGANPYIKDRCDTTPIDMASDEEIKLILLGKAN